MVPTVRVFTFEKEVKMALVLSVKKEESVYLVDTVSGSVTRIDIFLREGKIGVTADPKRVHVIRGSIAEKPILDRLKEQSQC